MRRIQRAVLLTALLTLGPVVTGCSGFDPDKLDVFGLNEKKKLPGERKDVFPEGVPGVTQGIPPEYLVGRQAEQAREAEAQAAEAAKQAAAAPVEPPKAKPKPKPRPRTVSNAPTRITVQPTAQSQPQQTRQAQPAQAPWPDQQPQQQQPAQAQQSPWPSPNQSSSSAPWPAAPASGTFSR
jgi:hypothetical protein